MNTHDANLLDSEALRKLRARCMALGLPTWVCDDADRITLMPEPSCTTCPELDTTHLRECIEAALKRATDTFAPGILPLFEDAWLIRLDVTAHPEKSGRLVALALGEDFAHSEGFETLLRDANLDRDELRSQLDSFTKFRRVDLDPLVQLLNWSADDLSALSENETALADLSKQLSYTYDEISTLYQLGRSMNNLFEPRLFVQAVCSQLHYLLDFDWIAVQYIPSSLAISGLERELLFEGELPLAQEVFTPYAVAVISSWESDQWTSILEIKESDLSRRCGSQVVAEPISHDGVVIGAIFAGAKCGTDPDASSIDMMLMDTTSDFLGVFHQNSARHEVQRSQFMGTVRALSSSIDAKDPYTRGHSDRVAHLAAQMARARNASPDQVEEIYITGLLHDVGKIGVPEATLCKAGRLTDEEFEQIKQHPVIGYDILKDIPLMTALLPGVLHHHERWDGGGYPHGLEGESIPLPGRLLAVVDAFDAMSSDRSYRAKMPREKVLSILREGAGTQWDEELISLFLTLDLTEYDEMVLRESDVAARAA